MTELTIRIIEEARNCPTCSEAIVSLTGNMPIKDAQITVAEDIKQLAGGCIDTFREKALGDIASYRDRAVVRY